MENLIHQRHKTAIASAVVLFIAAMSAKSVAQPISYDDSLTSISLENAASLGLDHGAWFGPTSADEGAVYKDSTNSTVFTGAELVIDYTSLNKTVPQFVIGGYNNDISGVEVKNNTVNIKNGGVDGNVYGGLAHFTMQTDNVTNPAGNAISSVTRLNQSFFVNNNEVQINSALGIISTDIYGGSAFIGIKTGDTTANASSAANASSSMNNVQLHSNSNNVLTGSHAAIGGNTFGGSSQIIIQSGNASTNAGTTGAQATTTITARYAQLHSDLNTVSIGNNTTIGQSVLGGYSQISLHSGNASANANIGASASTDADASLAQLHADSNVVFIDSNTTIEQSIFGGASQLILQSGSATAHANANVTNTIVTTSATANTDASLARLYSDSNTVVIRNNAKIKQSVFGGSSQITLQSANTDSFSTGGSYAYAYAYAYAYGYVNANGAQFHADSNAVIIGNGSTIGQSVLGGTSKIILQSGNANADADDDAYASAYADVDTSHTKLSADNNTVNFDGNLNGVNGAIYGGSIVFDVQTGEVTIGSGPSVTGLFINKDSVAQAINNTVSIEQNASFTSTSSLYGGHLTYNTASGFKPETYNVFSGNTLNYAAQTPTTLNTVANFENYNFTLTPGQQNTGKPLISAQNIVLGTDPSNTNDSSVVGTQSKIAVVGIYSGAILNADDQFILMQSAQPFTGSGGVGQTNYGVAQQGISLLYDVRTDVDTTNNQVTATILNCETVSGESCISPTPAPAPAARVNPQLKALSEGFLASNQLVTRGADMIAFDTIGAISTQNNHNGWVPFVTASGQHNRYNSGSHIKSNDYLVTGGLSYQQDHLTAAALIEGGWGSYDSNNSFNNAANVHGDGHNSYYGVGLLGRYDFNNGLYTDASLRYGRSKVKFDTNDIRNLATGQNANYDFHTNYFSAHIGIGYILPLNDNNDLDIFAKYLYTTTQGKDVNVAGDPIHFNQVNSSRVRLNAELNHKYSSTVTLNIGAGYEYEFDGKAKATTYGVYQIEAPSVKGSTGILSIGTSIKPSENSKLSFDAKARGYVGKHEGVSMTLKANYAF